MINCKAPEQHAYHVDIVDGVIVIFDATPGFCTATTDMVAPPKGIRTLGDHFLELGSSG